MLRFQSTLIGGSVSVVLGAVNAYLILTLTSAIWTHVQCLNVNMTDADRDLDACYRSSVHPKYYSHPDKLLTAPQIIKRHGFPCEIHHVTSEDGYVIELHRIPYSAKSPPGTGPKTPVYIQHGIMASAVNWVLPPVENALAYRVADKGYDVWLGNARGSSYSLKHVDYHHGNNDYWKFSWHEMGYYDIPAIIDYILEVTNHTKLKYIGHSMGCTMFFVCMSLRPEYNAKIDQMFALAPVAYVGNASSFFKMFAPFSYNLEYFYSIVGNGQLVPEPLRSIMTPLAAASCASHPKINCNICSNIYFMMFSSDGTQMNYTMLPVYTQHFPDRVSTRSFIHYGQNLVTQKFQEFDHRFAAPEWVKNLIPYLRNQGPSPKSYDLKKVTAPVVIFYADRDNLADPKDVTRLVNELPNLQASVKVCYQYFNHNDFLFGINVNELVYDKLLSIMEDNWEVDLMCEMNYVLNSKQS